MQIKDVEKGLGTTDFRFLIDTTFVKPKVDLSNDKKNIILYQNCYRIGKEAIVSRGSDPCRIKIINTAEGQVEHSYLLDDFGHLFYDQQLTSKFFIKFNDDTIEEVHLRKKINTFHNILSKNITGLYVQST